MDLDRLGEVRSVAKATVPLRRLVGSENVAEKRLPLEP